MTTLQGGLTYDDYAQLGDAAPQGGGFSTDFGPDPLSQITPPLFSYPDQGVTLTGRAYNGQPLYNLGPPPNVGYIAPNRGQTGFTNTGYFQGEVPTQPPLQGGTGGSPGVIGSTGFIMR